MTLGVDIGAVLRRERESRGWTLRDVAHRTRIPVQTLDALENNDYRKFPGNAYAKSFLAQYSDYLEIDAEGWLDHLEVGKSFANLTSYEYLREHDEFLGEEILPLKQPPSRPVHKTRAARKERPVRQPAEPAEPRVTESASALQPLVIFLFTASLLVAAAFGYRHLSEVVAAEDNETGPTEPARGFIEAPQFVHSRPAPTKPIVERAGPPPAVAAAVVVRDEAPSTPIVRAAAVAADGPPVSFDAPPPRAVIVEE